MIFFKTFLLTVEMSSEFFSMTFFNWLTIIVAVISAGINLTSFFKTRKWAKTAREDEFSKKLFVDFLLEEFPKAYEKFILSVDWVVAGKEFSSALKKFRHEILYFKYSHNAIYKNVTITLEKLDDQITKAAMTAKDSTNEREAIGDSMADSMDTIYKAFLVELPNDRIERYFKKSRHRDKK